MFKFKHKGSFINLETFLTRAGNVNLNGILHKYGREGVAALASATPVRTGLTSRSWDYRIRTTKGVSTIEWINTNIQNGTVIALILQYGHGTGTGGYVKGLDYINPAIQPIFEKMADDIWGEVSNA